LNTNSKKGRQRYEQFFSQHHQSVKDLMRRQNIPLLTISTADDVLLTLQQHFGQAKQRSSVLSRKVASVA